MKPEAFYGEPVEFTLTDGLVVSVMDAGAPQYTFSEYKKFLARLGCNGM